MKSGEERTNSRQGELDRRERSLIHQVFFSLFHYVRGQLLIVLILAFLYGAGFYWIGVPLWGLAALLCAPFHLVPVLGVAIAAIIPVLFLLIGGDGYQEVLLVLLLFGAIQALEAFYLTPTILGRELRLHPVLVFVSVLLGAIFFGPVGALVAAPLVAILLLIYRQTKGRYS